MEMKYRNLADRSESVVLIKELFETFNGQTALQFTQFLMSHDSELDALRILGWRVDMDIGVFVKLSPTGTVLQTLEGHCYNCPHGGNHGS